VTPQHLVDWLETYRTQITDASRILAYNVGLLADEQPLILKHEMLTHVEHSLALIKQLNLEIYTLARKIENASN
jgi:hypothetical protein